MEQNAAERWARMRTCIEPMNGLPTLYRRNGFGMALLGAKREIPGTAMFIKGYWLTLLFVPVLPVAFYVVTGGPLEYRFFGRISVGNFIRLYGWGAIGYLGSVLVESVIRAAIVLGLLFAIGAALHAVLSH